MWNDIHQTTGIDYNRNTCYGCCLQRYLDIVERRIGSNIQPSTSPSWRNLVFISSTHTIERALYEQCITILNNLSIPSTKKRSHSIASDQSSRNGEKDADIAVLLLQYLWRLVWSGGSRDTQNLISYPEPEELPEHLHVYDGSLDIPEFSHNDSPRDQRVKAVRGLMVAGLGMGYQDAIMTLGDLYLVSQNVRGRTGVCHGYWFSLFT